jgi:glycine cleavage system regulatory protein
MVAARYPALVAASEDALLYAPERAKSGVYQVEASYIITFIGDDRPGLVEELSRAISDAGGNWLESRLSQLAGKFAGLIRVSLPDANGAALEASLKGLSASGLSVRVTATGTPAAAAAASRLVILTVIGPDRQGIVREVSHALAQRQINVVEMDSRVSSAPMSAEQMFEAIIHAQIPVEASLHELADTLDHIANEMTLDIHVEESS